MAQYLSVLELSSLDGNNGFQINGEAAFDASGRSVSSAGDVNGDGFDDLIVGAPFADANGANSGASYVVFGTDAGFGAALELSSLDGNNGFQINGEAANDRSGYSVASAGDVNGDGFADIIVGADQADPNGGYSGASYVVFGTDAGFSAALELSGLDGNNGFQISGEAAYDVSGRSVSSAGDVNGDGFDDVIVGARGADPNGSFSGASYVVFGKAAGFGATLELSGLDGTNGFQISGEAASDFSGRSAASAGDVNGDGFADLIVGAFGADPNGASSGSSYVVFGTDAAFGATLELSALDGNNGFQINGEATYDTSGRSVSSAGDVNGDGFADLIVAAYGADPHGDASGASYVVFGKNTGFAPALELSSLDGNNGFQINGEATFDLSGQSVSSAGDFNGDGFADLIIGAADADPHGYGSGASWVVFGKASGFGATVELSGLDGNDGFQINGEAAYDFSGFSVATAGDVNGDGFADLIVGAFGADPNGDSSGASYVIYGAMPGEAVTRTGTAIANTIHGSDFADTLNGLAGNDTLLGHGGNDTLNGAGGLDTIDGGGGKDTLNGSSGFDTLTGEAGNDRLMGGTGKDTLNGGAGADRFIYAAASESTGVAYDIVKGADFAADAWDVTGNITAIDATIASGKLTTADFDALLAAKVDAGHLGARHAVIFTPTKGNLAGHTFLIVDQNNTAGYQAGADLVIELKTPANLAGIDTGDFI
jgi:Ca2+-binding RTX toxin-like protein